MSFLKKLRERVRRYSEYVFDGIKSLWNNKSDIGLWGCIKGFFSNFFESYSLLNMDIRDGYCI